MVTTADNCLLKVGDIDDFLSHALQSSADLAIGFAQKDRVIAAYPEVRRTWIPFRDVDVTGCNLFLFAGDKSRELVRFWEKFETSPKKFLKLAWALGPALFWNYFFSSLTLDEAFEKISRITGAKVKPVLMQNPAVSIDADKFTDIRQIEAILARDTKAVIQEQIKQATGRPVVIFDLDRTITRNGTYTPFLVYYALRHNPLRLLYSPLIILMMAAYGLKLIDRKKLKSIMFGLLVGHPDKAKLDKVCRAYVDSMLDTRVHPDALYTIQEWQKKNAYLILATASYDWMADIFSQRLKFDKVIATKSIMKGGKVFPGVDGENCYGLAKLSMVKTFLGTLSASLYKKQDIWFYTDHHTDIPLLDVCGHPVAVNPTPKLIKWMQTRSDGLSLDWLPPPRLIASMSFLTIIGVLSLTGLLFASVSTAMEQEITLAEVPEAAIRTFIAYKPGMEITRASVETVNNILVYELEGSIAGKEYEIEVTAEGEILDVDEDDTRFWL
jgi:HAD superfamily hydrolase (TIGR01490 family)